MPIYEFRCRKCGAVTEVLVRDRDDEVRCEECSSKEVEKLFSTFGTGGGSSSSNACTGST